MNNTREMSSNQLETLYRVMMKRIAKGLSAEKLSFLIGRAPDYISNIEMLHTRPYSITELKCIASALEEKNFKTFFPDLDDYTMVNVMMESEVYGNRLMHTCAIISGEHKKQTYFTLQEDARQEVPLIEIDKDIKTVKEEVKIARDAIKLLISADYFFEPRLPVHICQSINRFLKIIVSPAYIEQVLNSFCKDNAAAVLKKEEKGKHGFYYVAA